MRNSVFIRICILPLVFLIPPDIFLSSAKAIPLSHLTYFSKIKLSEPDKQNFPSIEVQPAQFMDFATLFGLKESDGSKDIADDTIQKVKSRAENYLVAVADYDTSLVNTPVTVNMLANDINPEGDPLIVTLCGYPSHGIVILNSDKTVTYTPYADYQGDDFFCYRICDVIKPALCADTQVYIYVKPADLNDLFVYTGVSPNGDGNNDTWKIRGIEKYPDNTVLIFNRWGDKVREFANYNNTTLSWDGKNENGEPLPNGTYFYILNVKNVGVLKGWIFIRGGKE